MGPLFGLASALSWGAGDFCGGLASRFGSVGLAILISQAIGLSAGIVSLVVTGEALPAAPALAWAALAGLCGISGIACFYRALSGGTMALIAPLAGVIGAVVPAAVAIVAGEQLSAVRGLGMVAGISAIALISVPRGRAAGAAGRHLRGADLLLALFAGLGFAGFYLGLNRSAATGGETWWPLLVVRVVGLAAVAAAIGAGVAVGRKGRARDRLVALLGVERVRLSAGKLGPLLVVPVFAGAGAGDFGGNLFFLFANAHGALAVAVVLSSLYPVVTAILAALLLRERLSRAQVTGVGLAVAAAALIGVG